MLSSPYECHLDLQDAIVEDFQEVSQYRLKLNKLQVIEIERQIDDIEDELLGTNQISDEYQWFAGLEAEYEADYQAKISQ